MKIDDLFNYGFSTIKCKYKPFSDEEAQTEYYPINDWEDFAKILHNIRKKGRFDICIMMDIEEEKYENKLSHNQ